MQKPQITFTSIETEEIAKHFPTEHTVVRTVISYSMSTATGDDYPVLIASGEAATYPDSMRDALTSLDWNTVLDTVFSEEEIAVLQTANDAYDHDYRTAWLSATALIESENAEVKGGPVQQLAMNRMLDRHNGEFGTHYRINEFGRYIVNDHPQFNAPKSE